jgi:pheromone shutdown protein TraB
VQPCAAELLKTRRAVRALTRHLREEFPKVAAAMVDERDEIMTQGLLNDCAGRSVAVVGMAHMDGIEGRWREAMGGDGGAVTLIS